MTDKTSGKRGQTPATNPCVAPNPGQSDPSARVWPSQPSTQGALGDGAIHVQGQSDGFLTMPSTSVPVTTSKLKDFPTESATTQHTDGAVDPTYKW